MAQQNRQQPKRDRRKRGIWFYVAATFLSLSLILMAAIIFQILTNRPDSPVPEISWPAQISEESPPDIEDESGSELFSTPAPADETPAAAPQPFDHGPFVISDFGDDYYYYGRTDSSPFAPAFDISDLDGWTLAAAPIGYGSRGGSRLDGTYDRSIAGKTQIKPGSSPAERGGDDCHTWTFFKKEFELPQDIESSVADMDVYGEHMVDDALIVFINGVEVYRYNAGTPDGGDVAIGQPVDWGSYQGYSSDPTPRPFTINSDYDNRLMDFPSTTFIHTTFSGTGLTSGIQRILRDAASRTNFNEVVHSGTNVLTAAVGQNSSKNDPDLLFDLKLVIAVKPEPREYAIVNPYEDVDWNRYKQYKAALHAHSTNSDGIAPARDVVLDHYNKGYDILALTDHNYLTKDWLTMANPLTGSENNDIRSGTYSGSFPGAGADTSWSWAVGATRNTGMISIPNTNEQSLMNHNNTFFTDLNNASGDTLDSILQKVWDTGGIGHINHPGRYTGSETMDLVEGAEVSHRRENIDKYAGLYMQFKSCLGLEIFNRLDYSSLSDRILWDNVLMEIIPNGRFVWGFANDDAHSLDEIGYNFNIMLMPELTSDAARKSMETGAFYAVARVNRRDEVNIFNETKGGNYLDSAWGDESTLYILGQPTPRITDITVSGSAITINGTDYDVIEWISNGVKIHTEYRADAGNSIDLNSHQERIGSYIRAQLKSGTGMAFTQPFVISPAG